MVKFGDFIEEHFVPEWQPYYCSYTRLKGWINEMEANDSESGSAMYRAAQQTFLEELKQNLGRVDAFYVTQENKAQADYQQLCRERAQLKDAENIDDVATARIFRRSYSNSSRIGDDPSIEEKADSLLERLAKLNDFAHTNAEGFRKITKKFEKRVGRSVAKAPESQALPNLNELMLGNLARYSFSNASTRLQPLQAALQALAQNQELDEPSNESPLLPRPLRPHLTQDFMPLLHPKASEAGLYEKVGWLALSGLRLVWSNAVLILVTIVVAQCAFLELSPQLTVRSWFVIWVALVALILLAQGKETDGVMMGATLLLNVTGILTLKEAWAAFANDVVLAVASLGGVSSVLAETGVIDAAFAPFLGKPKTYAVALARVALPTFVFNIGISNTCVMSCLMPVVEKWSSEIGIHQALFFLPLSYLLLVSGVVAMFSTSTNLVCQGQLRMHDIPQFSQFALALPGCMVSLMTLLYMILVVPIVLKRFRKNSSANCPDSPKTAAAAAPRTFSVYLQVVGNKIAGRKLEGSELLAQLSGGLSDVCHCERYGEIQKEIRGDFELHLDDILCLQTTAESIVRLRQTFGVRLLTQDQSEEKANADLELVQVVLDRQSDLVGHRLEGAKRRGKYGCSVVAFRPLKPVRGDLTFGLSSSVEVCQGDSVIFDAPPEFYSTYRDSSDFVLVRSLTTTSNRQESGNNLPDYAAPVSGAIVLAMIFLVGTQTLPLLEAVLAALSALIMSGCATLDSVMKSVKLRTVCVIVGAFGLGTAIGKEGVAKVLADLLLYLLSPFGSVGFLAAIFLATVALGVVFHGTAVVILMFPVCLQVAHSSSLPVHQVMAVLCMAATCQLLSPISYQTNLMAYTAAAYEFGDFTKVGVGLVALNALVAIPMCQYCFPVL
eukprot:TRINITY_DN4104_c0_g2_i1.p1 TRINITY_DN4104_c0_g2~~TRINITY_DN4104_c0_g2_i1.p1  ORF type:complete len:893 (-),score=132.96 TRINITY_DN4104_c0_g2_i1:428-3106(-)